MTNDNLLIIDEHIQSAISLSNFLEFQGYRSSEAYNAEDGEKIITSKNPFCIIIDSLLGGHSKEIIKKFQKKPFILLYNEESNCFDMKNIKAKIKKPVDNQEVLEAIKKL